MLKFLMVVLCMICLYYSLFGVVGGVCQPDEDGAEHGEDIRLNKGYQQFQTIHENHKDKADKR